MRNRFGVDVRRGFVVSFHTARGEVRCGVVRKFYRISGYGWRVETSVGDCGVDDVIKATAPSALIRRGCRIEVGTGAPGYRWVQGWQVRELTADGGWSVEMRLRDARAMLRAMLAAGVAR